MENQPAGSRDHFENLFKKSFDLFFDGLHRYAVTLVKDRDKASDVVQSVYVKWWENGKQIENLSEIKMYLYTGVYRTCLNEIRNDKSKSSFAQNYDQHKERLSHDAQNVMEFDELNERVKDAVNELPPQCKIIFCKSRFEQKRYTEIAQELGLSVKTIEAQMGKALRQLREKLKIYLLSPN